MRYRVSLTFKKPPTLIVTVEASNELAAKFIARSEAMNGGFGMPIRIGAVEVAQ